MCFVLSFRASIALGWNLRRCFVGPFFPSDSQVVTQSVLAEGKIPNIANCDEEEARNVKVFRAIVFC
jgi:hypothetical protein